MADSRAGLRTVVLVLLLTPFLLGFPAPLVAQQAADQPADALVGLAAAELQSMQETHYTHHSKIDHARGIYDTDCSGFVDDLLKQVAPAQYALVPTEPGWAEPRAYMFEQFFASLQSDSQAPGWAAVSRLIDAVPGDILAWQLEPFTPDSDTGHIVIIAAAPVMSANGTVSVPVYDASSIIHAGDSRVPGRGGVGSGTISFHVDANGAPIAFQFDKGDRFHTTDIAIGHLSPVSDLLGPETVGAIL